MKATATAQLSGVPKHCNKKHTQDRLMRLDPAWETAQDGLMLVDPAFGTAKPYPSHAAQWRKYHGRLAWLYNPWTGVLRHPAEVAADLFGQCIVIERALDTSVPKGKE